MTIITLTTDLGASSAQAGALYGVIWKISPGAQIVDLTHELSPGDILSGQVVLENALPYFPEGTIHMAAAAPLQDQSIRVIAAQLGTIFFVGPDNGLITPLLEQAETDRQTIEIYEAFYPTVGSGSKAAAMHTACAALAAQLANGVQPESLGKRVNNPQRANLPEPAMLTAGWRGQVVQVDHFGNLTTNIRPAHLDGMGKVKIVIAQQEIRGISKTFGDGKPGDLIALIDSSNRLSICVVNGNAAEYLNAKAGDFVEVKPAGK